MTKRSVAQLFLTFLFTSVIGWIYEVFLEVIVYRWGYSDRGVLCGPYCIVYGFGAVILLIFLTKLLKTKIKVTKINITPILVFVSIVILTTAVELAASYIMQWLTGGWMWDYTRFSPNFQGRVALNPSIRFGIGGMIFLYIINPIFNKLLSALSDKKLFILSAVLFFIFIFDIFFTFLY